VTLSVAVVGYGYWGSKHARIFSARPDVAVTLVDSDPGRLAEAQATFPSARLASTLDEALPTVDAVVIATPPRTHGPLALAALSADRHVLVEKPLATSVAQCQALIAEADARDLVLMTGHTFEYNAAVWKLRELAVNGELGELRYIDTARLNLGLYQEDVNVVWDLAPHDISIINYVLGRSPVAVAAWGNCHAGHTTEDVAYLQVQYADPDICAYVHVSWLDPCKVRRVTVVGTEKMAVYNDVSLNERIRVHDVGVTVPPPDETMQTIPMNYRYGDIVSPYISVREPLAVQDGHFIECITSGAAPRTDGQSGLEVVRVLEAASLAMERGRAVQIDGASSGPQVPTLTLAGPPERRVREGAG
jgi:predicted dehydrogenase